jgi:lipid-binding SYLF domain-containing protein
MKRSYLAIILIAATWGMALADSSTDRITDAKTYFENFMEAPGAGIPFALLENARCIVIVPSISGAGLVFGERYGLGTAMCRSEVGWTPPSTVRIAGGNFGRQIVSGHGDLILLVMSDTAAYRLIQSPLLLGSDGIVVSGPVGRYSTVDLESLRCANVDVLSYERIDGLFVETSLNGAFVRPADEINQTIYGSRVSQREILTGQVAIPQSALPLVSTITQYAEPPIAQ